MKAWKLYKSKKCQISVGIVLFVTGIVLLSTSSIIFNAIIDGQLQLSPEKYTFDLWRKPPMPITMSIYFFHWLNPEDLRNPNIKPRLEERGPYVFRETMEKVDIVWNSNGTVSFKRLRTWYFDEERSNGSLSDQITSLNAVAVSAAAQAKHMNYVLRQGLSLSLKTIVKDVHITKSVRELVFDGYEDLLIDVSKKMPKIKNIATVPFDKFAWFYQRNGSKEFDGVMTMGTGTKDLPLGSAQNWNYKPKTDAYEGECGKVYGSAGEFWPPHVPRDEVFMFMWVDMCRSIGFQFEKDVVFKGIRGYRFIGGDRTMDNGTKYPEKKCNCGGDCVPAGVVNASACKFGAPGFISFPHYYLADPFYLNQFEGLKPNKEQHELFITLEPRTGIPLEVSGKFQVNLLLSPVAALSVYNDVPRLYFPMLWFKQELEIPDNLASDLNLLISLPYIGTIVAYVTIVIGAVIIIIVLSIQYFRNNLDQKLNCIQLAMDSEPLNKNKENYMTAMKPLNKKRDYH